MGKHSNTPASLANEPNYSDSQKIEAELINILYQQARTVLLGLIPTATVAAALFYNKVPATYVFGWLSAVYLLILIRYLSILKFKSYQRSYTDTIKWGRQLAFLSFLSGCTWGAASILFFTPDHLQSFIILTLIIISLTITSMAALAPYLVAYFSYTTPAMIPLAWRYINIGQSDYAIFGILLILFIITLIPFARVNHRMLRQSVTLRFENFNLVQELTVQKEKAEHAMHEAEEASVAKTKFLAAASHDLRQPLHAMGLFLGILDDRIEDNDQKVILDKLKKSSVALSGLLDSLLDISKLDAGIVQAELRTFRIQSLFDALKHEFETSAQDKKLRLSFVSTGLWTQSDYRILERILRNLISNAIRYTDKGGIVIGCRRRAGKILLAVYDTGIGIQHDKMGDVFVEFHQLHNPERDRTKGLGLGLAIVQRMAKLIDAPILATSTPDKGSIFGLYLPRVDAAIQEQVSQAAWRNQHFLDNKLILIVDDEAEIRDSLSALLTGWHCKVITSASGAEALAKLHENIPDIILADYRLREEERGTDVIRRIQDKFPDTAIPAIIITGDTSPDRIKEAEASGYKIIHKPVSPDKLRGLISYALFNKQ